MNTDAEKIIFLPSRSSFHWRNGRQGSTFHHYRLFEWNFHLFSLESFFFQGKSSFNFTFQVISNPFRPIIWSADENSVSGQNAVSLLRREKKDSFRRLSGWLFCPNWLLFDLRNKWQVDFLHQNIFSRTLIFRPIRIREKIEFN